jgi:hypothetical protein
MNEDNACDERRNGPTSTSRTKERNREEINKQLIGYGVSKQTNIWK